MSGDFYYDLTKNHKQVNKLFGINFFGNHKNSIRLGWAGDYGMDIKLYAYFYNKGVRNIEYICDAPINSKVLCKIKYMGENSSIFLSVNGKSYKHNTPINPKMDMFSFYSLPYFGGKEPATKDTDIKLNVF